MSKVVIITNIPAPYRVDLFNYLIDNYDDEYKFKVIYSATTEDNRGWDENSSEIKNSVFLKSKSLSIKEKLDKKYVHLPIDIIEVLNRENPDVVIGSEYNPTCVIAFLWSKLKNKKFISWSDGTLNSERNINFIQKMLRKVICSKANAFIASSSKTKEAQIFYGAKKSKIFMSYLTVDLKKYIYEKKEFESNRILFVGRLTYTKGIDLLLNALNKVKGKYKLTIVGDGPEKEKLIKLSMDLGINNMVNFLGSKNGSELKQIYREHDIFVLPSRCDCFGLVLTEAMCNSMAVIGSKYADGSYDLIVNNKNGFIFNPYNESEFSAVIERVICDSNMIKDMGKNSLKMVNEFDFSKVALGFISAIEFVIEKNIGGRFV